MMKRSRLRFLVLALLAVAAGLAGNSMAAEPRETPQYFEGHVPESEEVLRAGKTAEMEAWLRRLVGRFWVEWSGMEELMDSMSPGSRRPVSIVDCVGIGAGAGVHCIFYSPKSGETSKEWASANGERSPDEPLHRDEVLRVSRVVVYGLDPNAARIRMMVAEQGSAQQVTGVLGNDRIASRIRCWNSPAMPVCDIGYYIHAPADSEDVRITYVTRYVTARYILHRMSRDQAAEAGRQIEAAQWEAESGSDVRKSNSGPTSSIRMNRNRPR